LLLVCPLQSKAQSVQLPSENQATGSVLPLNDTLALSGNTAFLTSASGDTVLTGRLKADSLKVYKPNPQRAVWLSVLCPGLGQVYNRRYWKLPIIGAGVLGVAYAIGWNSRYYNAYTNAYRDLIDNDPDTKSYTALLSKQTTDFSRSRWESTFKNRQQKYRRSRDLSYIGAAGVYLLCMLDAFVDAQLYDFDISPDLSILPAPIQGGKGGIGGIELSLAFNF